MCESYSYLCSQSTSYLINYEIQSRVFNVLDEDSQKIKWLTISCFSAWCALSIASAITRTVGIAEVFFVGLAVLFATPLTKNPISNAKVGLHEIFVHTPKNILRALYTPLEFIEGVFSIIIGTKYFIAVMNESMKINVIHAKKNTIGSIEHYKDLDTVDGISYEKFIKYQKSI